MSLFNRNNKKIEELSAQVADLQKQMSADYVCELIGQEQPQPEGTVTVADERTKRKLKLREFMKLYENDAVTFALVNFVTQRIVPSFVFTGDEKAVKKLNEWAGKRYFKRVLEDITLDMVLCGGAWAEAVWSSIEIEKFKIINPDKMDFIRDTNSNTMFDEDGEPLGYIQDFNGIFRYWYSNRIESDGKVIYTAPKGVDLRKKLRYYKLKSYGDSELGVSLLQANYRSAIIRTNIEDMVGEAAFRGGGLIAYVAGELPPDVKTNLRRDMEKIKSKNVFILTDKIKLDNVPIPELDQREALIYLFADIQCGGMGVPMELILSGSTTSRNSNTITDKTSDLEIRISSYQERLAEQVNEYIIKPLLENWNIKGEARIVFPPASPANQLNRSRVISSLARRNLMTYDPEMELYIRKELKLPTELLEKVYTEWKKNPPPLQQQAELGEGDANIVNKGDAKNNKMSPNTKETKPSEEKKDNPKELSLKMPEIPLNITVKTEPQEIVLKQPAIVKEEAIEDKELSQKKKKLLDLKVQKAEKELESTDTIAKEKLETEKKKRKAIEKLSGEQQ